MVLAQGLRPVVIGLLIGLGLAAISVRALQSMLYGVEAFDPVSFVGAGAVLAACAVSACLLPAWRAARIDPAATLRAD
jgi:putative ABC transport system permease protein